MSSRKLRFDGWVLDPESGDLERGSTRIRLQEQPVQVLRELITHVGSVVTREQLIALLWPKGVVDFDTGLNTVIRKLRSALGDLADTPRYIETLPRRGYRFIGVLDPDPDGPPDTAAAAAPAQPPAPPWAYLGPAPRSEPIPPDEAPSSTAATPAIGATATAPARTRPASIALIGTLAAAALLAGAYALWRAHPGASVTSVRLEAPAPGGLPARTIAVLPFENLSADTGDGFLATGIAESVLHRLAAVKSLSVIARTSSFTFRGRDVDARDIGRRLNARYLVEGSVQRAGERLRVTAQLLDANSDSDVWSLRLERRMGDIFELEDEISGKVADALAVSLAASPGNTPPAGAPKLDAYLAYLEGRALLSTFKIADAQAGIERLRRATEIDPAFAAAYAEEAHGLRLLQWLLHPGQSPDAEHERQAAALVDKALSLDPELGEAWVERAWGRQQDSNAFDARTDADFRKGLSLAPNYAQGYELYGEWLDTIGREDDALAMIERARELDPLTPRNHYFKGIILLGRGEWDQAVPLFLEALRANPTYHPALARLGMVEHLRGNFAEAAKFTERAITLDPTAEWTRESAAALYLDLADVAAAQDVLTKVSPRDLVRYCVSSYLGEARRAAAALYALPGAELKATVLAVDQNDCPSAVIRDDALARHDYARALHALEVCLPKDWGPVLADPEGDVQAICVVRYAAILMAAGERERAAKLLHDLLGATANAKGNPMYYAEVRGVALAVLGDTDGALKALEGAFAAEKWGWWYDLERAPELQGLRSHPRFQSLARRYQDLVSRQSALLAAMRRAGEVPYRPASAAASAKN